MNLPVASRVYRRCCWLRTVPINPALAPRIATGLPSKARWRAAATPSRSRSSAHRVRCNYIRACKSSASASFTRCFNVAIAGGLPCSRIPHSTTECRRSVLRRSACPVARDRTQPASSWLKEPLRTADREHLNGSSHAYSPVGGSWCLSTVSMYNTVLPARIDP